MTLGNKLAKLRKENNYTQEQLANVLGVSRQAISKWESDATYPETDKLIHIGKLFHCSMDYLLLEEDATAETARQNDSAHQAPASNEIFIESPLTKNLASCCKVMVSPVLAPTEKQPKYLLLGVDKITVLGEHTTQLGWYKTEEDIQKEISEITDAIQEGKNIYTLQYNVDVTDNGKLKDIKTELPDASRTRKKIIVGIVICFAVFLGYLGFKNGENLGRFLYALFH